VSPVACRACKATHDPLLSCSRAKRLADLAKPAVVHTVTPVTHAIPAVTHKLERDAQSKPVTHAKTDAERQKTRRLKAGQAMIDANRDRMRIKRAAHAKTA
jgi:hypothetical protein